MIVEGNRSLLDQIISNLITNAVKYSDAGGEVVVSVGKNLNALDTDGVAEA